MSKFIKRKYGANKKKSNHFKTVGFNFCIAFVLAGIFFLYLAQVNLTAPRAFEMQELETEAADLKSKNEQVKINIAELKSMKNLEERVASLNLVKSEEIVYVEENGVKVAAK